MDELIHTLSNLRLVLKNLKERVDDKEVKNDIDEAIIYLQNTINRLHLGGL